MKNKYLYDVEINDKRLAVKSDSYNWIVLYGSRKMSAINFEKKAERWYYTSLENLFARVFIKLHRLELKSLESRDVLTAIGIAEARMMELGAELDRKGVQNGWR